MEKYSGKYISILGDSISTLEGYNPPGYNLYYGKSFGLVRDVENIEETYWGKLIDYLNGKLLVNNSYSGSTIAQEDKMCEFPSAISLDRLQMLNREFSDPDLIVLFMGVNDFYRNIPCEYDYESKFDFAGAYYYCLNELLSIYPKADIWCMNFPSSYIKGDEEIYGNVNSYGVGKEKYIDAIRDVVEKINNDRIFLLDLDGLEKYYESNDGLHPNKKGMEELFEIIREAIDKLEY